VITDYTPRGFGKHLNNAEKKGASLVALIGETELQNNTVWLKNLQTKIQETVNQNNF
jgi:histidyl-tRNA synthetase